MTEPARAPKARFSDRVADYVRYRPGYPIEVVHTLERELGIRAGKTRVVDVGSGTGISAALFLGAGYEVVGVEPNAPMREAAEELLADASRFRSIDGAAEATGLADASCDLVVAAQALHWFDVPRARREMQRILAPGGAVAILFNDRKVNAGPFLRGYDEALRALSIDYAKVNHQNLSDTAIASFFGPRGCTLRAFPHHQEFDWDGLLGRALSSSYVPRAGQPGHDELVATLRDLFAAHANAGKVRFEYDAKLHFGTLDP